jgi:LacI family transcriptional regulator
MGFRFVLNEDLPNLTVAGAVEINVETEDCYVPARNRLRAAAGLVGIYCMGDGKSGVVQALNLKN